MCVFEVLSCNSADVFTCGHALPRRQSIQQAVFQRLGAGARGGGRLRRGQAGPLPGWLGSGPGLGERASKRGRGGEGRRGRCLGLSRRAYGGVALGVAEAVRGGGTGRGGGQADRGRLTG